MSALLDAVRVVTERKLAMVGGEPDGPATDYADAAAFAPIAVGTDIDVKEAYEIGRRCTIALFQHLADSGLIGEDFIRHPGFVRLGEGVISVWIDGVVTGALYEQRRTK